MHKLHTIGMDLAVVAIRNYFAKLGLAHEVADIYLALYNSGPQTLSELSRSSGVERTRIYRLLDSLMESGLIELDGHYKRGVIKAAPIANLNILINKREQELKGLQDELSLIEQVFARNSLSSPASRIQFYSGTEGIKQMIRNQTEARSDVRSILSEQVYEGANDSLFEQWVSTCDTAGLQMRSISSEMETYKDWQGKKQLVNWEGRYVSSDIFSIKHSTIIYDDVVSYFNWADDQLFGVEIYNNDVAQSQSQLYELLWQQAKPL